MGYLILPKGRKTWIFRTKINGQEVRWSTGERGEKAAQAKALELERRAQLLRSSPENLLRLSEAMVREVGRIEREVSPLQAQRAENALMHFRKWAGDIWMDEVDTKMLADYQSARFETASTSTLKKELDFVTRMLRLNGLLVIKPQPLRRKKETTVRAFTEPELKRFFEHAGKFKGLYAILYATGARLSELCPSPLSTHKPLLKTEIDWENNRILIRQSKQKPGEKSRPRWVRVDNEAMAWLRRQVAEQPGPYVFGPFNNSARDFDATLARAGIPKVNELGESLRIHSFRHTYGTIQAERQSGNILFVQNALGHKSTQTTQRYIHCEVATIPLGLDEIGGGWIQSVDTVKEKRENGAA